MVSHLSWEDEDNEYDVNLTVEPPDEQVSNAELFAIAMSHLSEQQKTCLLLQLDGFTLREIAESLYISETHVSVLLCRGRERFRHVYQHLKGGL
jgi:DNA-directed RNA polymerase specialized sigma24 family protein